ncbi:prenyltransferase/squalene oxidase repeat-containing protein [Streptomyces sp. NPDC049555]|uniref:prenyltransferase/squalene oxidase repeat-containing protein n=1 Tax=unclassified Streptomyces TaxID=2593676 RepID=UPI003415D4E0
MAPSPAARVRRAAATLATAAVLSALAAPAALADGGSPAPAAAPVAPGLFGTGDPQYDGVFRQSLALLAQHATGVTPAPQAVRWLAGQQCADGGFAAYRADTGRACDAKAGEFTDATATAVQALAATGGNEQAVAKAMTWLTAHQNEDGGWGMAPGNPTDANSTSSAIGALAAAGKDVAKATARSGRSPYDALLALQAGCDKNEDERGTFAPNDLASAAAALGMLGKGYLAGTPAKDTKDAKPADKPLKPLECADGDTSARPQDAPAGAEAVAAYLARKTEANGGYLKSAMPGAPEGPDLGTTADATLALAAGGHRAAAGKPLTWLQSADAKAAEWAKGNPGRLAKLVLAAHAAGADPRAFGGTDLVTALNETGPKQQPTGSASPEKKDEKKKDSGKGMGVWWIVAVFFLASTGVGFLISGRRKKNQP